MRIEMQGQTISSINSINHSSSQPVQSQKTIIENDTQVEEQEISDERLQQAIDSINEFLEMNHNSSKFVYHEGLDRYFVQVVDRDTEKVIKEVPPQKLLDAFYEMQKLVGMIVDEKI